MTLKSFCSSFVFQLFTNQDLPAPHSASIAIVAPTLIRETWSVNRSAKAFRSQKSFSNGRRIQT